MNIKERIEISHFINSRANQRMTLGFVEVVLAASLLFFVRTDDISLAHYIAVFGSTLLGVVGFISFSIALREAIKLEKILNKMVKENCAAEEFYNNPKVIKILLPEKESED